MESELYCKHSMHKQARLNVRADENQMHSFNNYQVYLVSKLF